jgi:hypothetical protein
VKLKVRSANLVLILDILLVCLGYTFYRAGGHLGYFGCDLIERDEDTLGAASNQVKSWVQVINMNYLPR